MFRFVLVSFMYLSNTLLDHLPVAMISWSSKPSCPSMDAIPIRNECVAKKPTLLSVYGSRSVFIILLSFAPVRGVPLWNLKSGSCGSLYLHENHFRKSLTGQSSLLFSNTSTTVAAALRLSLGHLRRTCKVSCLLFELTVRSSPSKVKLGTNVDSAFDKISCIRNAPAKARVATAQISSLSCSAYVLLCVSF
jgi:hypothetical protein